MQALLETTQGSCGVPKPSPRDRTILRLKAQGISNRGIAGRLGLDEKMIRKILRRLLNSKPKMLTTIWQAQADCKIP